MSTIINTILYSTIVCSILILGLLFLRYLFQKKVNARIFYFLWLFVAFRLLVPISIPIEVQNWVPSQDPQYQVDQTSNVKPTVIENAGIDSMINKSAAQPVQGNYQAQVGKPESQSLVGWPTVIFSIWVIGAVITTILITRKNCLAGTMLKKTKIGDLNSSFLIEYTTICKRYGVVQLPISVIDGLPSPCLYGLLRPKILIPANVQNQNDFTLMVAHELGHYRQKDHVWAFIRILCCIMYWFNPLVWLGAKISVLDGEISCDCMVVQMFSEKEQREQYAKILLLQLWRANKKVALSQSQMLLSNTKKDMKMRLDMILRTPKRTIFTLLVLIFTLVAVGCGTALKPVKSETKLMPAINPSSQHYPSQQVSLSPESEPQGMIKAIVEGGQTAASINGIKIDKKRGSILNIRRSITDSGLCMNELSVDGGSINSNVQFLTTARSLDYYIHVQFVDFNNDGTDEILLNIDYGNSGGWCDTHIFEIKDRQLVETLTFLNPLENTELGKEEIENQYDGVQIFLKQPQCCGAQVFPKTEGGYGVYISWEDYLSEEKTTIYNEFFIEKNEWESKYPLEDPLRISEDDLAKKVRTLLNDDFRLTPNFHVSASSITVYADLNGDKKANDAINTYWAYDIENNPFGCFIIEAYVGGSTTPIVNTYWFDGDRTRYNGIGDIKDNGREDIVIVIGDDLLRSEVHVMEYSDNGLEEILTLFNHEDKAIQDKYKYTLVDTQADWTWCNVEEYQGKDVLCLYDQYGDSMYLLSEHNDYRLIKK